MDSRGDDAPATTEDPAMTLSAATTRAPLRGTSLPRLAAWDAALLALTQRLAFLGVAGMLGVGILSAVDVLIFRALFNAPIHGLIEILQTVFATAIATVFAAGLAERANLQVELLTKLAGARGTRWMAVIGALALLVAFTALAWQCGVKAAHAQRIQSQTTLLGLKVAPFYWAIAGFFALCVPVQAVVSLSTLATALTATPRERFAEAGPAPVPRLWTTALLLLAGTAALIWGAGALVDAWRPALAGNPALLALGLFGLLWVLVLLSFPVAVALLATGLVGIAAMLGWNRAFLVMGAETVDLLTNPELSLMPLFLMMGAFATTAGLSGDIYRLAQAAFGAQRGGVAMATVAGCAGFGALTGSSIATAATIGAVALPEMKARGYAESLASGCVAAGATLGQLVPPSTIIVLYAILTEESIGKLYIAILGPALLSVLLYLAAIAILVRIQPHLAPGRDPFQFRELIRALGRAVGVLVLFAMVIGGIYSGVFTATEAAAVGAVFTFAMALLRGKLKGQALWQAAGETTRSVAMLYLLIVGALVLSFFLALSGLPNYLTAALSASGLPPLAIIVTLVLIFILLGTVMDATAVMIITAGVVAPLVASLGYDPIWWGVMMVVIVEIGVVTPPFGINLFVLKSLSATTPMGQIYRGVLPFVLADLLKIALLIAVPAIAIWLPSGAHF
jgi:TRAP transporter, DctM subunit